MQIKDEFRHLIDNIEDEELLKGYYQLIQKINGDQAGQLWNRLNENEKKELLLAYEESFYDHNLILYEEVKKQHERWLRL